MLEGDTYTAVLDRFEGDLAVLLLEADGRDLRELPVDRERLPEEARHQDAVLTVAVAGDELLAAEYDPEATERRTERAQSRFDRLSERPPDGDDDNDGGDGQ